MSTETPLPVIDETVLARIDQDRQSADIAHQRQEAKVRAAQLDAAATAQRVMQLDAVRTFLEARIGMPLAEALTEAQRELEVAEAALTETQATAEQKKEWLRDLEGHRRVVERNLSELRAKQDSAPEEKR